MFSLDEQFQKDLGIAELPEDVKGPLLKNLEQQIQDRISLRFAEGLEDAQIDEFGKINEGTIDEVKGWLVSVDPQYATSAQFAELGAAAGDTPGDDVLRQYAQMKWLERNVPDYAEIVLGVVNDVKKEILETKSKAV